MFRLEARENTESGHPRTGKLFFEPIEKKTNQDEKSETKKLSKVERKVKNASCN